MDWARTVSYSVRVGLTDRDPGTGDACTRSLGAAATGPPRRRPLTPTCWPAANPLSPLAIKAPDGRSFLPFCATFPQHRGKLPLTARYRLAVALSHHSSIPRA
jgi:hypothetical protein